MPLDARCWRLLFFNGLWAGLKRRPRVCLTLGSLSEVHPSLSHREEQGPDFGHPRRPDRFQAFVGGLPTLMWRDHGSFGLAMLPNQAGFGRGSSILPHGWEAPQGGRRSKDPRARPEPYRQASRHRRKRAGTGPAQFGNAATVWTEQTAVHLVSLCHVGNAT